MVSPFFCIRLCYDTPRVFNMIPPVFNMIPHVMLSCCHCHAVAVMLSLSIQLFRTVLNKVYLSFNALQRYFTFIYIRHKKMQFTAVFS